VLLDDEPGWVPMAATRARLRGALAEWLGSAGGVPLAAVVLEMGALVELKIDEGLGKGPAAAKPGLHGSDMDSG